MTTTLIQTQRSDQYGFGRLQVILKTVERCNLACDYCYYFFGGDESYRSRPPIISLAEVKNVRDFLVQGCTDIGIPHVNIVFHGGEPMLQKPRNFDAMCMTFREMKDVVEVTLGMQTNGTIISSEWVDVIRKHNVGVGISIDGTKALHDRHRRTVRGKGSYDMIIGNLDQFRTCTDNGDIGTISVVNTDIEYGPTIRRYSDDLGIKRMNFLLPDCSHDDGIPNGDSAEAYGRQLCDIFDAAMATGIRVREVERILERFQEKVSSERAVQRAADLKAVGKRHRANEIIVIHSDGTLDMDDSYIPAQAWRGRFETPHVGDVTLRSYLNSPQFRVVDEALDDVPAECSECEWCAICGGGDLENRWKEGRGFNNPSVYCSGLKLFYTHVVQYLYKNGYPKEKILRVLGLESS